MRIRRSLWGSNPIARPGLYEINGILFIDRDAACGTGAVGRVGVGRIDAPLKKICETTGR